MSDIENDADRTALCEVGRSSPSVTIIVPVRNEEQHIAHTLDQLLAQERQGIHIEILVVDGRSTDKTREIVAQYAKKHPEIRLLDNPQQLSSAARNKAIRQSHGEYLVLIDGHCEIPSRTYFIDLVDAFERSGADCLGRPQPLNVEGATTLQRAIAAARSSRLGHHPESFIYSDESQFVPAKSVAVAYRREVFDKVGLFDESFDAHEDGEFNYRCDQAGLTCYFTPQLTVKYFPRKSLKGLFKQMYRYGQGRVRLARTHRGNWVLSLAIPALFVLIVIFGAGLAAWVPSFRMWYLFGLSVYLTALVCSGVGFTSKCGEPGLLLRIPLVLITVHLGAGAGVLLEFLCVRPFRNS